VAFFVAASNQQGPKQPVLAQHVLLKDGDADQVVAIVPISGLITDTSAAQFDNDLTDIERDKSVKAVVLQVDTPGGSATASDEMLHRLKVFEKRRDDLKVTVSMGAMATSGGYYVSCGGDTIFAEPGTMTANIGVLMPNINVSGLMQKWGIQDATIVGAGGTYKEAGSPLKPEDAQSTAYLQGLVNTTLDQFKTVVVDNRFAGKTPAFASEIFDGRVLIGKAAIARGLVDKIGYLDDAETYAASGAGLSNPRYVRYDPAVNLLSQLLGGQSVNDLGGQSALAGTFDIDGSEIDVRQLAMLLASRPIYLWSGN
ncbi:MAG TPA: signal peptide peptidase SppA, partial [Tepidisphaeraceae bacterium]|nr:signal peptide peptidase SppA [Tepidisphaeraceae bacterium]